MRLVVIGIPGSRRSELLRKAAEGWIELSLIEVPWLNLIQKRTDLRSVVRAGDVVRIDSPGKHFETELALLRLGAELGDGEISPSRAELDRLSYERGRLLWPGVWYAGFCVALNRIADQLRDCPLHRCTADVEQIKTMFDKTATHTHLGTRGVPVAPAIGRLRSFDELVGHVGQCGWSQVFAKLAYGSSAAGAMAIRFGRQRIIAVTTVEWDQTDSADLPVLYNTRRLRTLVSLRDISRTFDALCPHGVHVERWLPKAGIDEHSFDVRILTINGMPAHMVARMSRSPLTNLHLLNTRGQIDRVRRRCGETLWESLLNSCRRGAAAFGRSHCIGFDVLIDNAFARHAILEANAFGDLLPGMIDNGMDTYQAQLQSLFGTGEPSARVA